MKKINRIISDALFFIAAKDCEGLETSLNNLIEWRKQTGDIDFPKQDYQEAMEYFLKKFKVIRHRMTIDEFKKNIAPYMKQGWVAMSSLKFWYYFPQKPRLMKEDGFWWGDDKQISLHMFNIEPVDNWQESLIEV